MHTLLIHPPLEYLLAIEYNHWLQYRRLSPSSTPSLRHSQLQDMQIVNGRCEIRDGEI